MRVSNRGYKFNQTFYDTGEIEYKLANNYAKNLYRTANIKLSENKDTIKFIAEADMHHGHKRSSMIYKNVLYEYCKNNDIHLIFDSGDIIDGIADRHSQSITDPEEQIISLIENHPYDKNIVNLITFGNHEFNVKNMNSLDIARVVMNERPDLVPVGYGIGIINILNDQLFLKHEIEGQE